MMLDPELRGSATLPGPRLEIPGPLSALTNRFLRTCLLGEAGHAGTVPSSSAWDGFLFTTTVIIIATAAAHSYTNTLCSTYRLLNG